MDELAPLRSTGLPLPDELAEGDVIVGKYRIERAIGRGAMGVVIAAMHLDLGQRVALKVLDVSAPDEARVARFRREARAVATLRGEHVARVTDVDSLPSGAPFIVMEYLEGADMRVTLAERGRLPIQEATERLLEACEALAEAHAHGIVHRDLKPSNLFLARRADGSTALKVLDFGISKLPRVDATEPHLTAASALVGSPHYMAPEQIRRPTDVDARADVWSLGVILYELITGKRPFDHRDERELLLCISTEEPRAVRELRPDVPAELEAAVGGCLAKDPSLRVNDVGELARRLAPFARPSAAPIVERIARLLSSGRTSRSLASEASPTLPAETLSPVTMADETAESAAGPAVTLTDMAPGSPPLDPLLGTRVADRFTLTKRLGAGAMGVVYEAMDGSSSGERVAVKLIRQDATANADARARLAREAQVAATLTGEHVVRVLGASPVDASGHAFIVMELLRGRDLSQEIQRLGAIDPGAVVPIFTQTCAGLAEAHARGVVHRDVKPANLFLHEGSEGQVVVKVCDFGIVKTTATEVAEPGAGGRTRTGFFLGSPAYMSPEQARDPSGVDASGDVFSLCIAMYEALSGKNPWAHCTTPGDFIVALWTESVKPLGEVAPWLDPRLVTIVHRGLERERGKRFRDAGELGAALDALPGSTAPLTFERLVSAPQAGSSFSARARRLRMWRAAGRSLAAAGVLGVFAGLGRWAVTAYPSMATGAQRAAESHEVPPPVIAAPEEKAAPAIAVPASAAPASAAPVPSSAVIAGPLRKPPTRRGASPARAVPSATASATPSAAPSVTPSAAPAPSDIEIETEIQRTL